MKRCLLLSLLVPLTSVADTVTPTIVPKTTRPWPGKDFWANPAEDWVIDDGYLVNRFSGGNRNLTILTAELGPTQAAFTLRTTVNQISFEARGDGFVGFEVGRQGQFDDYRDSAIHGVGLVAGVDFKGRPFIGNPSDTAEPIEMPLENLILELKAEPGEGEQYNCTLRALKATGKEVGKVSAKVHQSRLEGLVALSASTYPATPTNPAEPRPAESPAIKTQRGGDGRFAFSAVSLAGDKVIAHPERAFGPVLWTTYTLDNSGILRLLVQAAPLSRKTETFATLELPGREPIRAEIEKNSRTALFRVRKMPTDKDSPFTVKLAGESWQGTVKALPKSGKVVVASLSCNDSTGFPHNDLVANVASNNPDLITFHGDQIYEGVGGYGLIYDQRPNDRSLLSYLRKYAMHGWTWREILRDTPSITIPDDHDVFHGNLWGDGGKEADVTEGYGVSAQDSGGYKMSVEFVNAVHRSQTGNLPEPSDPAPCRSGISVYFTRFLFGPLDFVVLSDRQFKSAPRDLLPEAAIENGAAESPQWDPLIQSSHEDAELLGPRQEAFLRRWARNPVAGSRFRIAISQAPWCAPQTLPKGISVNSNVPGLEVFKPGEYALNDEPKADFDTNGWPQKKRADAVALLQQARAVQITGDQHLGTTGQYGINGQNNGPWWLSTPAIANVWPRRWMPSEEGKNRRSGDPKWLGEFKDAFGNPFNLHAVANPQDIDREPSRLFDRAVGYGITTWDTSNGQATLAVWPYWASPTKPAPDNVPAAGWPIVIEPATGRRVK